MGRSLPSLVIRGLFDEAYQQLLDLALELIQGRLVEWGFLKSGNFEGLL